MKDNAVMLILNHIYDACSIIENEKDWMEETDEELFEEEIEFLNDLYEELFDKTTEIEEYFGLLED